MVRNLLGRVLSFFRKPAGILVVIILIAAIFLIFNQVGNRNGRNVFIAEKGDIIQEVVISGQVKPAKEVDLAFERTGRISLVSGEVGDYVSSSKILASLDDSEAVSQVSQAEAGFSSALAQLEQARANVAAQKAKMAELQKGSRLEDIQAVQAELGRAQSDLDSFYANAINVISDSFARADEATRKQTDALFLDEDTFTPRLTFITNNPANEVIVKQARVAAEKELKTWQGEISEFRLAADPKLIEVALSRAATHLFVVRDFLNKTADLLPDVSGLSSDVLSTYKSNVNLARSSVNVAATNINNQDQIISSQKLVVERVKKELELKQAGTRQEQLEAQKALIDQAQASVSIQDALVRQARAVMESSQAQLQKSYIRAPFDGLVTELTAEVGEIIAPNVPVVSLISDAQFEIEASVPEIDIAKVSLGNLASVTLDAYGKENVFEARVASINPAETLVDKVPTYKITLQFLHRDARIKSGMTANINIMTNKVLGVVRIPQRAITEKDGKKFVEVAHQNGEVKSELREIEIGMRSTDGFVEILRGLSEGEKVFLE